MADIRLSHGLIVGTMLSIIVMAMAIDFETIHAARATPLPAVRRSCGPMWRSLLKTVTEALAPVWMADVWRSGSHKYHRA